MKNVHQADVEIIDEIRTVIRCACGYVAIATVEHVDQLDSGEEHVVPFHIDIVEPGEHEKQQIRFKDGRPFLDESGQPVYRTIRPAHPVMLGSATSSPGSCPLP